MTTDELLTTLEAALIGESSKCWVDVYAVQLAVDKIRRAEAFAAAYEHFIEQDADTDLDELYATALTAALENYRATSGANNRAAGETE